jgi:crossover junction endodeoxyribonuclease RuvC
MVRIIGLDPGLRNTGWGVIEAEGTRLIYVADGAVHSDPEAPLAERLLQIHTQVLEVLRQFTPDEAAIEETFVNTDARATLKLGQARGAVMLAPAACKVPVAEYAPNQVKKSVVGAGPCRKDAGQAHGETVAAQGRPAYGGFHRCAGHCHLPCPPPGLAAPEGPAHSFLTCSAFSGSITFEVESNTMRLTSKGQVTIPKHIREKLGVRPGDEIGFREEGQQVILEGGLGEGGQASIGGRIEKALDFIDRLRREGRVLPLGKSVDAHMDDLRGYSEDADDPGFQRRP